MALNDIPGNSKFCFKYLLKIHINFFIHLSPCYPVFTLSLIYPWCRPVYGSSTQFCTHESQESSPTMYKLVDSFSVDGIINQRITLDVPLNYSKLNNGKITIVANIIQKYDPSIHVDSTVVFPDAVKPIAYLQGGPGFPCALSLTNSGYVKVLLEKGYLVILYDQRGTGLSSPIEVSTMDRTVVRNDNELDDEHCKRQLEYILNFRADNIVEDMEVIRKSLFGKKKWLLLGQSYGGFCSFTYMSRYPDSLEAVMVTGGVPPIGHTADDVYRQTYKRTTERNVHYYRKYPQDIQRVKNILSYLSQNDVRLPNGGKLSVERFQQLGIKFGASGGTDSLHAFVTEFWWALDTSGAPTYSILNQIQNESSFDTNLIYALFQEAIYCDGGRSEGQKSNWAADRTRFAAGNENYVYTESLASSLSPVYFTGEMVYKSMYDDYVELSKLKKLAFALHANTSWSSLYNPEVLRELSWEKLPVVSTTYFYDQYVDFQLTMDVKERIFQGNGNLRQYITSEFFHNGLRADPERVLKSMFKLFDGEYD